MYRIKDFNQLPDCCPVCEHIFRYDIFALANDFPYLYKLDIAGQLWEHIANCDNCLKQYCIYIAAKSRFPFQGLKILSFWVEVNKLFTTYKNLFQKRIE